jgi:hypothetical protein
MESPKTTIDKLYGKKPIPTFIQPTSPLLYTKNGSDYPDSAIKCNTSTTNELIIKITTTITKLIPTLRFQSTKFFNL